MYGRILGACTGAGCVAGAIALPNTGGNAVVTLTIAVAAGLATWGVFYARNSR